MQRIHPPVHFWCWWCGDGFEFWLSLRQHLDRCLARLETRETREIYDRAHPKGGYLVKRQSPPSPESREEARNVQE